MGAADSCLYIERECKTEDNYPILGSQTPVVCLCTSVWVHIWTIDWACVPTHYHLHPTPTWLLPHHPCYVLVERSARLELDGYDSVVWHVALEACASSTQWEQLDCWYMDGTGLQGRGRYPRRTRCSGGICVFRTSRLDWYENSDLRPEYATGTT